MASHDTHLPGQYKMLTSQRGHSSSRGEDRTSDNSFAEEQDRSSNFFSTYLDMSRNRNDISLIQAACESNDVAKIEEALNILSREFPGGNILHYALTSAIQNNSTNIVSWLLEHDAKPCLASLSGFQVAHGSAGTTTEMVQLLLDNGWDINRRTRNLNMPDAEPLLWHVVGDADFVAWALDHGATVIPNDFDRSSPELRPDLLSNDFHYCRPLLERAAARATVATFEILRALGAASGPRCLHEAVWSAASAYAIEKRQEQQGNSQVADRNLAKTWAERFAMVRHLVDDLGYDVNSRDDLEYGRKIFGRSGEPLAYVGGVQSVAPDAQELIYFLLDRGAHTHQWATGIGRPEFVEIVKEWKRQYADRNCDA